MTLAFIIAILLVGFALIFLEIFFIPGTTLFGIAGGVAVLIGVLMMYGYYGSTVGHITLITCLIAIVISVFMGFKVIQSNKLAMKGEINSKVNNEDVSFISIGETGFTLTELRPNGKANIGGKKVEVYSTGDYIARNSPVEVFKVTGNKVFVQPHNKS